MSRDEREGFAVSGTRSPRFASTLSRRATTSLGVWPRRLKWVMGMNADLSGLARKGFVVFAYCRDG